MKYFYLIIPFFTICCQNNLSKKDDLSCLDYNFDIKQILELTDSLSFYAIGRSELLFKKAIEIAKLRGISENEFRVRRLEKEGLTVGLTEDDKLLFKSKIKESSVSEILFYGLYLPVFRNGEHSIVSRGFDILGDFDMQYGGVVLLSFTNNGSKVRIIENEEINLKKQKKEKVLKVLVETPKSTSNHCFYLTYDSCIKDWLKRNKSQFLGHNG